MFLLMIGLVIVKLLSHIFSLWLITFFKGVLDGTHIFVMTDERYFQSNQKKSSDYMTKSFIHDRGMIALLKSLSSNILWAFSSRSLLSPDYKNSVNLCQPNEIL